MDISWIQKLNLERWYNMIVAVGLLFAILFGTKQIELIDPLGGFLISISMVLLGIGEKINHKVVKTYRKGFIGFFDPIENRHVVVEPNVIQESGRKLVRKPLFLGIVFDILSALLFASGFVMVLTP